MIYKQNGQNKLLSINKHFCTETVNPTAKKKKKKKRKKKKKKRKKEKIRK